jgi:hypothetical protein
LVAAVQSIVSPHRDDHHCDTETKSEIGPPSCKSYPLTTLESRSTWLLGSRSRQVRKPCAGANKVYSRAQRINIHSRTLSHRNSFLLSVKHLAARILAKINRTRRQYTDW